MISTGRIIIVSVVYILFFQGISGQFVRPGNLGNVPANTVTSRPSNCNYIISAGNGGTCVVTTTDVEKKFNLITDQMARTKLQFIAQNSVLQTQLTNLSQIDRNLALQIDGIRRDLQLLKSGFQTPSPGGSLPTASANVNQLIQALDSRLTNLSLQHQRDAVAAAQTDSALQQQLTQVMRDNQQLKSTVSKLTQDLNTFRQNYASSLQQLTTQIRVIAAGSAPGTAAPAPTSNVIPASVLQNLRALNASVQKNAQDISALNTQQTSTRTILTNHTQEIRDIHVELNITDSRIQNVKNRADLAYNAVSNLNNNVVGPMRNDISKLKNDVNAAQSTIKNLQTGQVSLLNTTVFMKSDITTLQTDLTQGQRKQDQAILQYASALTNTVGRPLQAQPQLQSLQQQLKTQLSPNAFVAPPLLTTPGSSFPAPPTLFPRPG